MGVPPATKLDSNGDFYDGDHLPDYCGGQLGLPHEGGAGAVLDDLRRGAAHVDVDGTGRCSFGHYGGCPRHLRRVVAKKLHGDGLFFGV